MEVSKVTPTEVAMNFDIANKYLTFAKVVGLYSFKDGNLTYDIYPLMGLTPPRIILTQPIARVVTKMSLSKAMLTMYELEKSARFGFDNDLGYHIQLNDDIYIWTVENDSAKFIKASDDSNEALLLFELDLEGTTKEEIPAVFYTTDGTIGARKSIRYKVVA